MVDGIEREGGDITADHMVLPDEEPSEIIEFFNGSTVFITGATGFLGKMFLEKLLRTCENVARIYILARPKKGKEINKRLEEIFEGAAFEPLRRLRPNFREKVRIISGDILLENLGMDPKDVTTLISEVDCVIHCAATVKFDEHIRLAGYMNIRCVKDLIAIAKQMKKLRAMLYVSTAYSNCTRKEIEETIYDPPISGDNLLKLCETLNDDQLRKITPILLGDVPNTYVYTKAVAEGVVKAEAENLPIAVFRPSIVIASVKEPVAGWIDNLYGATGVLVGAALGLLRTLRGNYDATAEMVPADYVVNAGLAALWDIATIKSLNDNKESKDQQTSREEKFEKEVPVYNFVSSPLTPINWREFMRYSEKHAPNVPSPLQVWHYFFAIYKSKLAYTIATFLLHTVPAYLVDFIAVCIGRKPLLIKGYQKIQKFTDVIAYFASTDWKFSNNNVQSVWKRMNSTDKKHFYFSMENFNWDSYFYTYVRGARVYLLKDPLETLPEGQKKYNKLMVAHYTLLTFLACMAVYFLLYLCRTIFS